jgi:hypothetical protein
MNNQKSPVPVPILENPVPEISAQHLPIVLLPATPFFVTAVSPLPCDAADETVSNAEEQYGSEESKCKTYFFNNAGLVAAK